MKKLLSLISVMMIAAAPCALAQTAAEYIKAGDVYYAKFNDAGALTEYERAAALEPTNYEALWKTARVYMNVGDRIDYRQKDHELRQQQYYRTSETFLRKALNLKPNDSFVRFLKAALLGRRARAMSQKQQVAIAYQIKAEIDKSLELDPRNDMAWHALAYWHRTLAEVSGAARFFGSIFFGSIPKGSFEEAVKDFQKAIAINPSYCNHHIELGRTYLALKKKDLAVKEFQIALDCPNLTSMCEHFKERARRALAKLGNSA
jgi:tetratricopeptide (TPR) repeat protein